MTASTQVLQNNRFTLSYAGSPVWEIDGKSVTADSPVAFEQLLSLYQKNRTEFLKCLHGHFAIILRDNEKNTLLAASDRIGVYRLYWSQTSVGDIQVSTCLEDIRKQQQDTPELSADALYCYMYYHMIPTPFSIYSNIKKLPPGQCLTYENGQVSIEPYWLPQFDEPQNANIDTLSTNLHQILKDSVSGSLTDQAQYAAFLSGGLDSSTVVGVMSQLENQSTHSYSIGFNAKEYDETPFARLTAKHFGAQHHEYFVTPEDIVSAVPKIAAAYHEPFGNSSALPVYYCAKIAAENGVQLMLAGDGGDELFGGNTRYASQRHYRYYQALPKIIRRGLFDHLINALPSGLPLASKAQNYIKQANIPLPDRLQIYNFLHRHDPLEMFNRDYLQTVDTNIPLTIQRQQYARPQNASELNRMLYLDWLITLADNDLRKVSSMCELAGVEVAYPLLTDELIAFSCTVPSAMKLKKGQLRYFYKYAMREFLPQETLKKSKHGFGLPFGVWLKDYQPLRELAHDSLSKLKTREYFNPAFIDKAQKMHEGTHASYYGELIWIMMMLELWLSTHQSSYRG